MTKPFGYVRKLPSGKYQASYVGPDGSRHNAEQTYRRESDARRWLRHEQTAIEQGTWDSPALPQTTFGDFCAEYINTKTHPTTGALLRDSTKKHYRQLLATHLSGFAHLQLQEITYPLVEKWWSVAIAGGQVTTRARAYKLLSATMKRAVNHGLIEKTPCTLPGVHNAATGREIISATPYEVSQLIRAINPRFKFLVLVMANAGLRFGEAIALRRSSFSLVGEGDHRHWEVSVSKAVSWGEAGPKEQAPKSKAGIRTNKLHTALSASVEDHLSHLTPEGDPLLTTNGKGGYVRHDVFTNSFKRAVKKIGANPLLTPHSLRHCAASEYHRAGANFAELKRFLGDSSDSVVARYLHETDRSGDLTLKMRPMFLESDGVSDAAIFEEFYRYQRTSKK